MENEIKPVVFKHVSQKPFDDKYVTDAEVAVVRLVAKGLSNKDIAKQLHKSPRTVQAQLHNLCKRGGIKKRYEIAYRFIKDGLIKVEEL